MSSPTPDEPPRLRRRERGRARRRLRFLRQLRELQMRDAGGFVFELYRFGEQRDGLVRAKLDTLIATDKEIRALEGLLGQSGDGREVRQPGIGGACAFCGAFHSREASFCSACGATLGARAEEPALEEPVFAEAPLVEEPVEPEGEVTIVRQAGDDAMHPLASSNGAAAEENGQLPAPEEVAPAHPQRGADS